MNTTFLILSLFLFNNGDPMQREYNGGVLNPGSSLRLFWMNSDQNSVDAEFVGVQGVTTRVSEDGKKFYYRINYKVKSRKEIRAFQITAIVFDAFRRFRENWRTGRVVDLKAGEVAEGFFEKEVSREEAELLGGSFSYIGTTISPTGGASHFDVDSVFVQVRSLVLGFKSSWVNL